jgi:hypothetical protein
MAAQFAARLQHQQLVYPNEIGDVVNGRGRPPGTRDLRQLGHPRKAGDVFLCHPFMVHTATWPHRGAGPRMIAQPAVNAPDGFVLDGSDPSPVAQAIVNGASHGGLSSRRSGTSK